MSADGTTINRLGIVQNCWVVPDLDIAMRGWLRQGYGPFLTIRNLDLPDAIYRGRNVPLNISIGLVQVGSLAIELIQQHSAGPSAYRDAYASNQSGFHHVCVISDDSNAEKKKLQKQGIEIASEVSLAGMEMFYADTRAELGCMLEVISDSPALRGFFQAVVDASDEWDGNDPIRPFGMAGA